MARPSTRRRSASSYLLAILVASTLFELRVLIAMCIAATMAYDFFFLPPMGSFNVNDPQDWVALGAFLVTAVIGCRISTSERKHARGSYKGTPGDREAIRVKQPSLRREGPG